MHFHIFIFGLLFLVTTRPTTAGLISINGISPSKSTMTNSCDVSASSCSLKCTRESNCQGLGVEEKIWAIECDGNSCHDLTARCSKGQSCSVSCNGLSACQGAVFHGKWQIACEGFGACLGVTIMEINQPITCKGASSCGGLSATCTEGQSCSAICQGVFACRRARFGGKWNLDCRGVSSCQNLALQEARLEAIEEQEEARLEAIEEQEEARLDLEAIEEQEGARWEAIKEHEEARVKALEDYFY